MQPAADRMREALSQARIGAPAIPLVSNVTATATSDPEAIRTRLVDQVTGQVRWQESMSFLADEGVTQLVEIGAGKVLSGLARRIDKRLSARAVGTPEDIAAFLQDGA